MVSAPAKAAKPPRPNILKAGRRLAFWAECQARWDLFLFAFVQPLRQLLDDGFQFINLGLNPGITLPGVDAETAPAAAPPTTQP